MINFISDYKKSACIRERDRMMAMNKAYDLLRDYLPFRRPPGKKCPKVDNYRYIITIFFIL